MRRFHLILLDDMSSEPRRIDFHAEGPDHAFQVARNETDGTHVELWDGDNLLARMTKSTANMWKLLPCEELEPAPLSNISARHQEASRPGERYSPATRPSPAS
jgi:hypothetical protein